MWLMLPGHQPSGAPPAPPYQMAIVPPATVRRNLGGGSIPLSWVSRSAPKRLQSPIVWLCSPAGEFLDVEATLPTPPELFTAPQSRPDGSGLASCRLPRNRRQRP